MRNRNMKIYKKWSNNKHIYEKFMHEKTWNYIFCTSFLLHFAQLDFKILVLSFCIFIKSFFFFLICILFYYFIFHISFLLHFAQLDCIILILSFCIFIAFFVHLLVFKFLKLYINSNIVRFIKPCISIYELLLLSSCGDLPVVIMLNIFEYKNYSDLLDWSSLVLVFS